MLANQMIARKRYNAQTWLILLEFVSYVKKFQMDTWDGYMNWNSWYGEMFKIVYFTHWYITALWK